MAEKLIGRKDGSAQVPIPSRGTAPVSRAPSESGPFYKKGRLSVMPLSVLLPQLSDVALLPQLAPQLERRLAAIQDRAAQHETGATEQQDRRVLEESMLTQALQWIRMRTEEDE